MQSAWDNSEGPGADTSPPVNEPAKKTAQELGWTAPTPINYEAAKSKDPIQPSHQITAQYEWDGAVGDLGPEVPELENMLFNTKFRVEQGDSMDKLNVYDVLVEGPKQVKLVHSFQDAGLHPNMMKIIDLIGYKKPTPIQQYTIPAVNQGQDLIAIAQTGSGKTAAYLIPIVSRLTGKAKKWAAPRPDPTRYDPQVDATRAEPLVLIICPTRELAMQIFDETRRFCYRSMLRPCVVYGGAPRREQLEDLKRGCDILIGTPGRLKDFVETETRWLSLRRIKYTILDEADELIQPDWNEHMKSMLSGAAANNDEDHHYMMFSATFTKEAREMAAKYLEDDHIKITVGRSGSVHSNIMQEVIWVDQDKKMQALFDLISSMPPCRTLVFCNNNGQCDTIDDFLYNENFPVTSMHSGRTQYEREDAIRSFRTGKCPIMVTSNVAARGLDVKNVMHIINFDLPSGQYGGVQEYVHRIGRTARMGNLGQATSFYNDRNEDIAADLVNTLLETNQHVPEFLEQFKHKSGKAVFDDDKSDADHDEVGATVGEAGGWSDDAAAPEKKLDTGATWGAEEAAPVDDIAW